MGYRVTVEERPDPAEVAVVREGLIGYNERQVGPDGYIPVTLLVRDEQGAVAGGLLGSIYWGWLAVDILWLADAARGQNLGSELLRRAEELARDQGCHAAHLDTMSFQARGFYERHGYQVFGTLHDIPRGHQRFFMQKSLVGPPAAGEEPGAQPRASV